MLSKWRDKRTLTLAEAVPGGLRSVARLADVGDAANVSAAVTNGYQIVTGRDCIHCCGRHFLPLNLTETEINVLQRFGMGVMGRF